MKISVEISMYPLDTNYIPPIQSFIDHLNELAGIKVKTSSMSTQIFGDYDVVMGALQAAMKKQFLGDRKISMVLKIINSDLDYAYQNP